jgi:hypothetical protein
LASAALQGKETADSVRIITHSEGIMIRNSVLFSLFAISIAGFANAKQQDFRDINGRGFTVYYGLDSGSTGESMWSYATGVHVTLEYGTPGVTRVVLVNKCSERGTPYQYTFDCDYGHDGTWIPGNCRILGDTYTTDYYYRTAAGRIPITSANHGYSLNCRQEIAISPKPDEWLVDITGKNNFEVSFR